MKRLLRTALWVGGLLVLASGCRSPQGEAIDVPDGLVAVNTEAEKPTASAASAPIQKPVDARTLTGAVPVDTDGIPSAIVELWRAGASQFGIYVSKTQECSEEPKGTCREGEEWSFVRSKRALSRRTCSCGVPQSSEKILTAKEVQNLERHLHALVLVNAPVACAQTAPQVQVELQSKDGELTVFAVNYGQCGTQNLLTPRVDAQSFEALLSVLGAVRF